MSDKPWMTELFNDLKDMLHSVDPDVCDMERSWWRDRLDYWCDVVYDELRGTRTVPPLIHPDKRKRSSEGDR